MSEFDKELNISISTIQANKILFCLYEAVKKGEPIEVEKTIIENGLKDYHKTKMEKKMPTDEEIKIILIENGLYAEIEDTNDFIKDLKQLLNN